ncbi:hypothetical protein YC2023_045974 [Brassica napus]
MLVLCSVLVIFSLILVRPVVQPVSDSGFLRVSKYWFFHKIQTGFFLGHRVYRFNCGFGSDFKTLPKGFCIRVNAHNGVSDGKTTSMFLNSWAHICSQANHFLPEDLSPSYDHEPTYFSKDSKNHSSDDTWLQKNVSAKLRRCDLVAIGALFVILYLYVALFFTNPIGMSTL